MMIVNMNDAYELANGDEYQVLFIDTEEGAVAPVYGRQRGQTQWFSMRHNLDGTIYASCHDELNIVPKVLTKPYKYTAGYQPVVSVNDVPVPPGDEDKEVCLPLRAGPVQKVQSKPRTHVEFSILGDPDNLVYLPRAHTILRLYKGQICAYVIGENSDYGFYLNNTFEEAKALIEGN
jgi:hypothetical protein